DARYVLAMEYPTKAAIASRKTVMMKITWNHMEGSFYLPDRSRSRVRGDRSRFNDARLEACGQRTDDRHVTRGRVRLTIDGHTVLRGHGCQRHHGGGDRLLLLDDRHLDRRQTPVLVVGGDRQADG